MFKIYPFILFILASCQILNAQTANWTALNPATFPTNMSGQIHGISRVSQLKFHPTNANKMYAVSARGGLFISSNGGNNWTVAPGTDFMPYARLASICVDPSNDQILYLGAGDHNYYYNGSGVWKSTNGGNTFTQTSLNNLLVVDMIMDPLDNNKIVAITNAGIYKTSNAGLNWSLKSAVRAFDDLKQKTINSRVLYACTTDSAFFRSNDFGETWSQITSGIILPVGITNGNGCRIAVTPADSNIVYLAMVANGGTIYKSTNGGTSFTAIKTAASPYLTYYNNSSGSSGQGDYNFGLGVDRINPDIVYVVAHNVWKSTNGGSAWTQLTNWYEKVHTDMHQIITNPYNNNQLWNMNDGGVWLSTDGGNNWLPRSDGLNGYEIYHGNCSPTRRDMMSIGTQDNGELYASGNGWFTNRGGDWGSQCAFDYRANSSMVYYYESNKRRLVTGGESTYGLPSRVSNLDDIAFHRSNPNLAFVADSFIYRTTTLTNATPTWTQIASLGNIIKAMHVSFADANKLFIITADGKMHISDNALSAAPTFTMVNLPTTIVNQASITSIKSNANVIYITANTQVYRSANNGASWTNITFNLPLVNHVRIIADEFYSNNELVMIASANTVYYKIASANSWSIYNTGLPTRTDAIDFSIFNDSSNNSTIRYACYGRSVWETDIDDLRALKADFGVDNSNPCIGQSVQFSDQSTGNVISRTWSFPGGTPSSATISNPLVTYNSNGTYPVTLTVSDGTNSDVKTMPNYISTFGSNLPLVEGFEGTDNPPGGWKNLDNGTAGIAWAKSALAGGFGNSGNSMMFDNYSWNYPGEKDELYVKRISLTGISAPKLKFDIAYQVFSGYSDSLAVLVSTNCGNTFTKVFQKGGTVLSTAGSGGNNFVPTSTQWRTDSVDLTAYVGQPNVLIAFQNINGYGNKLYVDNINIQGTCTLPSLASINASQLAICNGQNTTLSIGSGNLNSATQWTWYTGSCGGTLVGSGNTITVSPSITTTYYVRGEGACVTPGSCSSITITVHQLPTVTASNISGCSGNVLSLVGTPLGGIFNKPNPYLGPSTTYNYTYTDVNGCTNISSNASITIHSLPSVQATVFPNDSICNGSTITLSGSGANTFTWTNGVASPLNGVAFSPSISSSYTVTGTDANGCSASSTLPIHVIALTVNAIGDSICGSGNVNLSALGSGTPRWYLNASGGLPIFNGPIYSPSVSTTTTYYVEDNLFIGTTGSNSSVGPLNNAIGLGLQSTLNQWTLFNVLQPCTLQSVIVYPGAAGNVILEQRDQTGTMVLNSSTLTVTASQIGTPVLMTLNWPLTIGNGYRLYRAASSVSLYRNSSGSAYPYTSPNVVITGNSFNQNFFYWAYQWQVSSLTNNYCTSPRVPVVATVFTLPMVNATNVSACVGSAVNLIGTPAGGSFNQANPYTGPSTNYVYTYTDANGCSASSLPASITMTACNSTLQLKLYLQGYYSGSGFMTAALLNQSVGSDPLHTDSITVELRNNFPPYGLVASTKTMLNTNGTATCQFSALSGSYYVVIKHRNTLTTWSTTSISFSGGTTIYDFSDTHSKAYGSNMLEMEPGIWALYTGELAYDDNIDLSDYSLLEIDLNAFVFGYVPTDLNGDGNVDLFDFSILEPNINQFIFSAHP